MKRRFFTKRPWILIDDDQPEDQYHYVLLKDIERVSWQRDWMGNISDNITRVTMVDGSHYNLPNATPEDFLVSLEDPDWF